MTRAEWIEVAQGIVAKWPHQPISDASLAQFFHDLEDFPAEQVKVAVESLYRDGREFTPNGAQIRKRIFELAADTPRWSELWRLTLKVIDPYEVEGTIACLEDFHPLAGQWIRELGVYQLATSEDPMGVLEAQCRHKWENMVARAERDATFIGLPTAGLRAIERVNSGPRQIGDVLKELSS